MDKKIARPLSAHPAIAFRTKPRRQSGVKARRARGARAMRDRRTPR